jgi:hypothetical protein
MEMGANISVRKIRRCSTVPGAGSWSLGEWIRTSVIAGRFWHWVAIYLMLMAIRGLTVTSVI